jgi:hypothetical protein
LAYPDADVVLEDEAGINKVLAGVPDPAGACDGWLVKS